MARESKLKKKCREWIREAYGGRLVHVSPKGVNGYPDSDLLIPGCPLVKVEFKAPGETLSHEQIREMEWLVRNGFEYWVVSDLHDFMGWSSLHQRRHNDGTATATA
jgi:hypothetical protein